MFQRIVTVVLVAGTATATVSVIAYGIRQDWVYVLANAAFGVACGGSLLIRYLEIEVKQLRKELNELKERMPAK